MSDPRESGYRKAVEAVRALMIGNHGLNGPEDSYFNEALLVAERAMKISPSIYSRDGVAESIAQAMAEHAGFDWRYCAQSQWIGDAEAGLKRLRELVGEK